MSPILTTCALWFEAQKFALEIPSENNTKIVSVIVFFIIISYFLENNMRFILGNNVKLKVYDAFQIFLLKSRFRGRHWNFIEDNDKRTHIKSFETFFVNLIR